MATKYTFKILTTGPRRGAYARIFQDGHFKEEIGPIEYYGSSPAEEQAQEKKIAARAARQRIYEYKQLDSLRLSRMTANPRKKRKLKWGVPIPLPGHAGSIVIERGGAVLYKPGRKPTRKPPNTYPVRRNGKKATAPKPKSKWTAAARAQFAKRMKAARKKAAARKAKGGQR